MPFTSKRKEHSTFKTSKEKLRGLGGTPSKKTVGKVNGKSRWAKAYIITGYVSF